MTCLSPPFFYLKGFHKKHHRFKPLCINADCQDFEIFTFQFIIKFFHGGHFFDTRWTPGCPDVDENDCPIVKLFCFHLVGKSRGLNEGQMDFKRYEFLVLDKKKTCKRQKKKS
jgi:hypothetical protein